jgi:hypothetical protein
MNCGRLARREHNPDLAALVFRFDYCSKINRRPLDCRLINRYCRPILFNGSWPRPWADVTTAESLHECIVKVKVNVREVQLLRRLPA